MKDIIIKHKFVFALIAILLVILIIIRIGDHVVPVVAPVSSTTPTSSTSTGGIFAPGGVTGTKTNTNTTTTVVPAKPATVTTNTSLKMTTSKELNYEAYVDQLGKNKSKCNAYAESLYNKLYAATLSSVTFSGNYNETTGQCYLDVIGRKTVEGSATSTTYYYFRNALTTTLLAECSRVGTSSAVNDNVYVCTDKVSGKSITKLQYDNLTADYK